MTDTTSAAPIMEPCGFCGMPCTLNEYHPYAACLMFKACHNSETVRANLEAVRTQTITNQAPSDAELRTLWASQDGFHPDPLIFARAVLAKWSAQPTGAGVPQPVTRDDDALIRQMLEVLEHIQRCIGYQTATIHNGSATWQQIEDAITAARARLEGVR